MAEEETNDRSIADEIADDISKDIKTPVDIFFLALFVAGVLSLAATTLVGPCGNVTDERLHKDSRIADHVPGATVIVNRALLMEDTVVLPGACGIIEQVDEEAGMVTVRILAKAPPGYIDEIAARSSGLTMIEGEGDSFTEPSAVIGPVVGGGDAAEASLSYRPQHAFSGIFEFPVRTALFLHAGSPKDEVDIRFITPVATQPYTNLVRSFFLDSIYVIFPILAVILIFLVAVGNRFQKKRTVWYERHTLRSTYLSRLMQDREKTRILQQQWRTIVSASSGEDAKQWRDSIDLLDETLDGVLELLRFGGNDLSKKLEDMTKDDLHTIERLWNAHSLILRLQGKTEEGEKGPPPLTRHLLKRIVDIYRESFIWLGLLPHSETGDEDK